MQLVMKHIRKLGNNKIYSSSEFSVFINNLRNYLDLDTVSVYSVPKKYLEGDFIASEAVQKVLFYCEPMINNGVSNTEALQRKFRNTWNSIWNNFVYDNNLDDEFYFLLCRVGLSQTKELPKELQRMYNNIVSWYLFTSSETNLLDRGMTMEDMLNFLVVLDNHDFVEKCLPSLMKRGD